FVTSLMEWVCDCGGNVEGLLVTPDQGTDSAASTIPLSFWSYTSFFISPPPPPTFCNKSTKLYTFPSSPIIRPLLGAYWLMSGILLPPFTQKEKAPKRALLLYSIDYQFY